MIFTLKIELLYGGNAKSDWAATIELDGASTLEELHFIIQDAVEFDDDHLYEFYSARTERSREQVCFDDQNGKVFNTTIESLYPLKKNWNLYYLFDYGDSWLFKISKSRKKPHEPEPGMEYPRLISEAGKRPEQYPSWDDE